MESSLLCLGENSYKQFMMMIAAPPKASSSAAALWLSSTPMQVQWPHQTLAAAPNHLLMKRRINQCGHFIHRRVRAIAVR
jgi:hypothetical protein